jgi:hypothetical protein
MFKTPQGKSNNNVKGLDQLLVTYGDLLKKEREK